MTVSGSFEIIFTLALTIAGAYPIGAYMADLFDNRRTFLSPIVGPIERALYRLAGIEPDVEQKWHEYAIAMIAFGGVCMLGLYALLRLQGFLPLNPQAVRRPSLDGQLLEKTSLQGNFAARPAA